MELEEMSRRYEKLYAGVIYDSIIFDLKHDKKFVVDLNINNKTHKGTYFGKAFTCLGQKVKDIHKIDDTVRIEMFKHFHDHCIQVIDTGGDKSVAHFGDISGKLAKKFGSKCVVTDGYTRDANIISNDKYSVFCSGITPIDAFEKWQIIDYQCNITLPAMNGGFVDISPEDYIFCDGDGVLVIHSEIAEQALIMAEKRSRNEEIVRSRLLETKDIQDLYDEIGRW